MARAENLVNSEASRSYDKLGRKFRTFLAIASLSAVLQAPHLAQAELSSDDLVEPNPYTILLDTVTPPGVNEFIDESEGFVRDGDLYSASVAFSEGASGAIEKLNEELEQLEVSEDNVAEDGADGPLFSYTPLELVNSAIVSTDSSHARQILKVILSSPYVEAVSHNFELRSVDDGFFRIHPPTVSQSTGNTMYREVTQGDGGVIFVLDTSISNELTIDYNLIDSLCVSVDGLCKGFDGGRVNSEVHAELVSGIAAGEGYKGGGTGVAPEAGVVNVEVWHPRDPRGYNSADVVAAVYKVALAEAYNHSPGEFRAFAINYSGAEYVDYSGSNCDEVNFVFQRIAAMTRTKGVPFFAAAGNDSVPKAGWPACSSLVQAVTGSDRIRPEKGEIVHAQPIDPTDLTLAQANEAYIWKADGDVWGLGGTSVSTPLVTAQALLYQLASQKYRGITLTPSEIYAFMAQYGDKVPYADYTGYAWAVRIDNIFRNMGFMPYARLVFPSITQSRIQ